MAQNTNADGCVSPTNDGGHEGWMDGGGGGGGGEGGGGIKTFFSVEVL